MKKTNKVISLVLAVLLAFSSIPLMASARAVPEKANTLDKIIETENLLEVADWLVQNINSRKDLILETVLRYVIFANRGKADFKAALGTKDALKLKEEEAAKIVVDILNKTLKEKTADITSQKWWKPATDAAKILGITIKIDSVDGILKTANSICEKVDQKFVFGTIDIDVGDLNGLNGSAIDGVSVAKNGNAGVLKAVIKWLADNMNIVKKVFINASNNKLDLGALNVIKVDGKKIPVIAAEEINKLLNKKAIKQQIHDGLKLSAKVDPEKFTADELIAAWFINAMSGKDATKAEATKVTGLTLNQFFNEYANKAYAKFLKDLLNHDNVKNFIKTINVEKKFNEAYNFTDDTFKDIFNEGKKNGFVEQLNNVLCKIVETFVTDSTYKELVALGLKTGGNENINKNFNVVLKYTLPIMARYKDPDVADAKTGVIEGFDFSWFTSANIKDLTTEQLAVKILKIFFPGWFHFDKFAEAKLDKTGAEAKLADADTIEELLFLAVYLGNEIVEMPSSGTWATAKQGNFKLAGASLKAYTDQIFDGNKFKALDDKKVIRLAFDMAVALGARALHYNRENTRFVLPADVMSNKKVMSSQDYLDAVVNWGIDMIHGVPAVADPEVLPKEKDGFYKLNYILNELVDFSFINGCGNKEFKFAIDTMVLDVFLPSLCDFDIDKAVGILAQNEKSELFNKTFSAAAVDIADRLLVAVLETKEVGYATGDVDNDKKITASDARLALRISVNLEKDVTKLQLKAANVDGDDKVTAADARLILRVSVKLDKFSA